MSFEDKNHEENPRICIKEKLSFVREGVIKLPPGFRFQPTDQEIVFEYLVSKVLSCPLPTSVVPEVVNICNFNPWDLPGEWEQERYFFSKKETNYGHENRVNRKTSDGFWRPTGLDNHVTRCCRNNTNSRTISGMKKTLIFYKNKPSTTRTHWIMHEYRLVHSSTSPTTTTNDEESWVEMGDWVLCHVLLNKPSRKSFKYDKQQNYAKNDAIIDQDDAISCSSTSSCGSSEVTHEVSSGIKQYHEETFDVL